MCFALGQCKIGCPEGQALLPTEMCKCVPQSEVDALFKPKSNLVTPLNLEAKEADVLFEDFGTSEDYVKL